MVTTTAAASMSILCLHVEALASSTIPGVVVSSNTGINPSRGMTSPTLNLAIATS